MVQLKTKNLKDLAVTSAKLGNDAVVSSKIAANAIDDVTYIADDLINSQHYAPLSVDGEHLSTDSVQTVLRGKFLGRFSAVSNITLPVAVTSINFSDQIFENNQTGKLLGDASQEGVVLVPSDNRCNIIDVSTGEPLDDGGSNTIYGRITTSQISLAGTTTWTNGTPNVVGTGTSFLAELQIGDILIGPDDELYKVASVPSNISATLSGNFNGTTTGGETTDRHRITLSFFINNVGETPQAVNGEDVDVFFPESVYLLDIPFNSFLTGNAVTVGGGVAPHTHVLTDVTDVTATSSEINQALDGIGANVTAANLDTLTDGIDTLLHNHNSLYFTEAELQSVSPSTSGSSKIGYDNTSRTHITSSNLQDAVTQLEQKTGSFGVLQQEFAAEAVTPGNNFVQTLGTTPGNVNKVQMFVNGVLARLGLDYSISGTTVSWLASAEYDIDLLDNVFFRYEV